MEQKKSPCEWKVNELLVVISVDFLVKFFQSPKFKQTMPTMHNFNACQLQFSSKIKVLKKYLMTASTAVAQLVSSRVPKGHTAT